MQILAYREISLPNGYLKRIASKVSVESGILSNRIKIDWNLLGDDASQITFSVTVG